MLSVGVHQRKNWRYKVSYHWDHFHGYLGGRGGGGMLVKRMSTCSHSDCPDHISVKLVAGEHIIVVEVLGVVTGCAV